MKHLLTALFVLFVFTPSLGLAEQATATIDGNCAVHNAAVNVPAGKTAATFAVTALSAGSKCKVGGTPDVKGWGITKGGTKVYYWSQFQSQAPSEVGGPLANVSLAAGAYEIFVDGGSGATVTVTYALK